MRPEDPNDELPQNLGLTVGFIGTIIVTIGYIVDAIGEGIELMELRQTQETEQQGNVQQSNQLSQINNKLDYLMREVEKLKKGG